MFGRDLGAQLAVVNSLTTLSTIATEAALPEIAARFLGSAEKIRRSSALQSCPSSVLSWLRRSQQPG